MTDEDRNVVREACDALAVFNEKVRRCAVRGIHIRLEPIERATIGVWFEAKFTRTEIIYPSS